jgi:hypothetical protein
VIIITSLTRDRVQLAHTEFVHRRSLVIHASDQVEQAQEKNEKLIHSLVPAFLAKVWAMS